MEKIEWKKKSPASESTKHQLLKAFSVLRPPKRLLREDETSCDEMRVAVECDKEVLNAYFISTIC